MAQALPPVARGRGAEIGSIRHTTLATARLRFLFVAAKIWRHAGRVGVSYSDHYQDQGLFHRLMDRVRELRLAATASCRW